MPTPLYVVAGQSNAVRVDQFDGVNEFIAENGINAEYAAYAVNGTSIAPSPGRNDDWYPFEDGDPDTGELLEALIDTIVAALAAQPDAYLAGILWVQGEADAKPDISADYETNLQALYDRLVFEFGDDFNFTISGLSENMPTYRGTDDQLTVSQAQENIAAANDNITLLDPDTAIALQGLYSIEAVADRIHFNNEGADAIATMFMDQFDDGAFLGAAYTYTTVTDTADQKTWLRYTDSSATQDDALIRQITYDDGQVETKFWEQDIIVLTTLVDGRDKFAWIAIERTFDENGDLDSRTAHLDDGRVVTTIYEDGTRASVTRVDESDSFQWAEIERNIDSDGKTTEQITTYDDGRVATEVFEDDIRLSVEFVDEGDNFHWLSLRSEYDEDGNLVKKIKTFDNGREKITTFTYEDDILGAAPIVDDLAFI